MTVANSAFFQHWVWYSKWMTQLMDALPHITWVLTWLTVGLSVEEGGAETEGTNVLHTMNTRSQSSALYSDERGTICKQLQLLWSMVLSLGFWCDKVRWFQVEGLVATSSISKVTKHLKSLTSLLVSDIVWFGLPKTKGLQTYQRDHRPMQILQTTQTTHVLSTSLKCSSSCCCYCCCCQHSTFLVLLQ